VRRGDGLCALQLSLLQSPLPSPVALALALLPHARAESQVDAANIWSSSPAATTATGRATSSASRIPGPSVFAGRNITPDKETDIGNWTDEQIAAAITTGKRPDGRQLAPLSYMTKEDVAAIVAFLRSIPPVKK